MTDIVEASSDRVAKALAINAGRHAGINEYVVGESNSPFFDPPINSNLTTGNLKGFQPVSTSDPSGADWQLTFEGGEAFVAGAYIARDEQTTITGDFTNGTRNIGVGWSATGNGGVIRDSLVIQPKDEFSDNGQFTSLGSVSDGEDISFFDTRDTVPQLAVNQGRLELGTTLIDISDVGVLEFGDFRDTLLQLDTSGNASITAVKKLIASSGLDVNADATLGQSSTTTIDYILALSGRSFDPSNPNNGMVWYRSDLNEFRVRENGQTKTLDTTTV